MSSYIIEDAQINWETLINNLRNNPATLDYEHFKAIVSTYWKQQEYKDQLQVDCAEIYKNLELFKPQSQAFFLSLIFDFNIRGWVEDELAYTFEKLLSYPSSSDHHFLILRYYLEFQLQIFSPHSKVINELNALFELQDEIGQMFIIIENLVKL